MTDQKKGRLKDFLKNAMPKPYPLELPDAGLVFIKHLSIGDSGKLNQMVLEKKIATDAEIVAHYLALVARTSDEPNVEVLPFQASAFTPNDLTVFAASALKRDEKVLERAPDPVAELAKRVREQWRKTEETVKRILHTNRMWLPADVASSIAQADQINELAKSWRDRIVPATIVPGGIVPGDLGSVSIATPDSVEIPFPDLNAGSNERRTAKASEAIQSAVEQSLETNRLISEQIGSIFDMVKEWNGYLTREQKAEAVQRDEDVTAVKKTIRIALWTLIITAFVGAITCVIAWKTLDDARESGVKTEKAMADQLHALELQHADLLEMLKASAADRDAEMAAIASLKSKPEEKNPTPVSP